MRIEPFKMRVTPEQSRVVQETLCKNGYIFSTGAQIEDGLHFSFLYATEANKILIGQTEQYFDVHRLPELTFERFQELYVPVLKCEFVLPKKWCVKDCDESVNDWFNKNASATIGYSYGHVNRGYRGYMHYPKLDKRSFYKQVQKGYTEITFEQFKKYVLKQENMKEEKKIIGYKVPFDMCQGRVKKGDILTKKGDGEWAMSAWKGVVYIPQEIVEQWEAVYKEDNIPKITVNGHEGEFFDTYVKFGCAEISKEVFIDLYTCREYTNTNRDVESVTIGKGVFTKDMIKEIAKYFIQKDKAKSDE